MPCSDHAASSALNNRLSGRLEEEFLKLIDKACRPEGLKKSDLVPGGVALSQVVERVGLGLPSRVLVARTQELKIRGVRSRGGAAWIDFASM